MIERRHKKLRMALGTSLMALSLSAIPMPASTAQAAAPADRTEFRLPAQSLEQSLKDVARQTGVNILFASDLVSGIQALGVTGKLTAREAVGRLIANQKLDIGGDGHGGLVLKARQMGESREAEAATNEIESADIIVTAQKRSERLQDVPLSVAQLSSESLTQYGEKHLADYATRIPGLVVESYYGNPGSTTVTIRGVSTGNPDGNPTVAVYVDDVPVSSSIAAGGANTIGVDLMTHSVKNVEVLKGPQGTLYGAGSLGGLVKFTMRQPSLENVEFSAGEEIYTFSHSGKIGSTAHAEGSLPLVRDELAINFSTSYDYSPGYIDNSLNGEKDINDGKSFGIIGGALWKPSESFSLKLRAVYDRSKYNAYGNTVGDANISKSDNVALEFPLYLQTGQFQKFALVYGILEYDLGSAAITSITSYNNKKAQRHSDASAIFNPIFGVLAGFENRFVMKKFTQELRLASSEDKILSWSIGGYYTHERVTTFAGGVAYDPVSKQPTIAENPFLVFDNLSVFEEKAIFGGLGYDVTPEWNLAGSLRYSNQRLKGAQNTSGFLLGGSTIVDSLADAPANVWTYALNSEYHIQRDLMAYVHIASGYQVGGQNIPVAGVQMPLTYKSSKAVNYEIGIKSKLLDNRLTANVSAFYIDWRDIQIPEFLPATNGFFIGNAGKAAVKGVEGNLDYAFPVGLTLSTSLTYLDARLKSDAPGLSASRGDRLPSSPKFSSTIGLDYTRSISTDVDFRFSALWRYVGSRNSGFPSTASNYHLKAYSSVDFSAGLSFGRWDLNAYVRNVADRTLIISQFGANTAVPLAPRSVGLALDVKY